MAKTHALVRHHTFGRPAAPVVIVRPTRRAKVRRAARAVGGFVRRRAPGAAKRSLPLVGTAGAAAAIGYLETQKKLNFIPTVMGSRAATIGIGGFLVTRFFKNPTARMVGAAAVIAAAFDIGRVKGGGVSGFDDDGGAGRGGGF